MNEMKIIENVQKFVWNFEDIKTELIEHTAKYAGLVVNDDNLADMEKTQKEIASTRTKLAKFRMAVKRELEKPFDKFYLQVEELLNLVEKVETPIKDQLLVYEERRKELKAVEVQGVIDAVVAELGLNEKYSSQIVVTSKMLNRGAKKSETKAEIQQRVCWFLDIQQKEIEAATFKQQKIEMAEFMVETLSVGLVTPLTFAEIESKIDSLDIGSLKTYIANLVTERKTREDRTKKLAEQEVLDRQEKARVEAERLEARRLESVRQMEINAANLVEQQETERQRKQAEFDRNQSLASESKNHIENVQRLAEINKPPEPIVIKPKDKLYNAQFVAYSVNAEQVDKIGEFISNMGIEFKHAVKKAT